MGTGTKWLHTSILGAHPQRIWTVFDLWVGKTRANDDPSSIKHLGVDETLSRRGIHVTIGVDLDAPRVIHAIEGKGTNNVCKASPGI